MTRSSLHVVALLGVAILVGSCSKTDSPTDPGGDGGTSTPDVSLIITANDSTPADGDTVQVTVRVTNGSAPGAVEVTGLAVTNVAAAGLVLVGSSPAQGTFDGRVVCGRWALSRSARAHRSR